MIVMIDNYDSFTYNLVQYFSELGQDVVVHRNDKINIDNFNFRYGSHEINILRKIGSKIRIFSNEEI